MRKFYVNESWLDKAINLPKRMTKKAAGYDFEAAEDYSIVPIWRSVLNHMTIAPQKVHTGVSVEMNEDEVLIIANRSSNPIKFLMSLATGIGVIDADYEGEISFDFWNFGLRTVEIKKGQRIGQGIFFKFLTTDEDTPSKRVRKSGANGSTDLEKS